jgi:HEAT repeat protein
MGGKPSYLGVAVADWVVALKGSDPLDRRLAAHALAEIGRTAREAIPALTEALQDSETFVRVWAAAALARVEPENPDAILALIAGTRDATNFVRSLAAWHLGPLGRSIPESRRRCRSYAHFLRTTTRTRALRQRWRCRT